MTTKTTKAGKTTAAAVAVEKKMEVRGDHALLLRSAIRTEDGKDKNVLDDFQKLAQFTKNGLQIRIEFCAAPLSKNLFQWAFNLSKTNLKKSYDASGYGWQNEEKKRELREPSGRFLFFHQVVNKEASGDVTESVEGLTLGEKSETSDLAGFVHFHFSLQGEVADELEGEPSLFVDEIQLLPAFQRQGIGRYTMVLLELIARKYKMSSITIPVVKGNPIANSFFLKSVKGFSLDPVYQEDDVQMILSKHFAPATTTATTTTATAATTATTTSA